MTSSVTGPPRSFELDDFQREAIGYLDEGTSVVVSAPTGSGKTYIAEHAIARALARGQRSVYTTPIKALSNQKWRDLGNWVGHADVGLLTGDNSINPDASVLVMTTEVLRNMLYAEPERLKTTGVVVMDEVHYLQDSYRGPVWEEVIIHLPEHILLVALSATVSNADQLAAWMSDVHRPAVAVTETTRPVVLESTLLVGEKRKPRLITVPVLKKGRANAEGRRFDLERKQRSRKHGGRPPSTRRPWRTPRRPEVIRFLDRRDLLPAITFIFSRAGCEDAVDALMGAGVVLTEGDEADQIALLADQRTAHLSPPELEALGYRRWRTALEAGIAAHHAGVVPVFKEVVEELFTLGLLRSVFATETLALGINMPARTVVVEKLSKFTGEHHEPLSPGDYTQLTGRAGRRGIDDRGHAFVLWSPFTTFDEIAGLARSTSFELQSAFRPTYNMACHFVGRYTRHEAEELIARSFGQFQANAKIDALVERRDLLRQRLGDAVPSVPEPDAEFKRALLASLSALRPGHVIDIGQTVAVLSVAWRRRQVRVQVIDRDGVVRTLDPEALDAPPPVVATLEIDAAFDPHNPSHQHDVVGRLRNVRRRSKRSRPVNGPEQSPGPWMDSDLRETRRELRRVEKRIRERRARLTDRFAAVVGLLTELDYIHEWSLSKRGELLRRTFHELDLVIAESLLDGHLDGLDAPDLAGVLSTLVFEPRSSFESSDEWLSGPAAARAIAGIERCHSRVRRLESAYGLPESRDIDSGLFAATHGWAAGVGLDDVLGESELSAGDFVRAMKQVIDVLAQLAQIAPNPRTRSAAAEAVDAIRRGIVETPLTVGDAT